MRIKKEVRAKKLSSLIFIPLTLSFIGLFFVFEASSVKSFSEVGNSFHYFKLQFLWIALGIGVMFFLSFFDYHKFYYLSFPLMMMTIILLIVVLIPGLGTQAGGARRWLDLGIINFQPTEIAKFSVIVYLSSWFIHRERKRFFSFVTLLGALIFLIILQPDMGTAIIVFALSIIIYFLAGVELSYLFLLLPVSFAGFLLLIKTSPYRFRRLSAFLDPSSDPLGIGYHVNQILISLGNGGLLGQGFGASRQKYLFLPEAHTDSIFAIIGEEFGFIGGFLLIFVFFTLMYYVYRVSAGAPDRYGRLLTGGIFAYFALQIIINLGGVVGLMPLTGVPLPFISYGGSNLLVSFALLGILLNVAKKSKKFTVQ
ncbi:cell division protein FtsW [Candidatus Roizmanbacteria bacterium RIFCSPLOWO2_12_FULL_40_12]|uniref:Probable peptidoglycan glycosyltransferase FtsW n=1 Tax=Candidatus Roizmanbacteria bacterium RIFCSPLOWO2_01_FULL_40_42 TaxID=1802066 RepID=A0A1F7J4W7_9BACT|nr:MAG: cell division protein FtsW [Candidatus Roizmanbacteria bacterium RIFCSPHIGHO2_01_FULL_40_98]OGK27396.1 MAG: cell division protein FtsW [Candidatus Roizmanbacteria bacterium RIFCSPHIGHO2_02_FULL_40_53]OGK30731.1 MAG: cell division protein FtsW [Candidatus Roizmanbacteria bacterium RIFCSPHIGHO2_12_41_18]OGK36181.1 MAG: cell division protein FtsW [Candidatus Roizmanbacteria bacterium RIFCSPHIGHO2_12_FULL_40_130]OGK50630.1 MAG: cell division protein FtsW [Candidatus Roizmanbacteria bacteriu